MSNITINWLSSPKNEMGRILQEKLNKFVEEYKGEPDGFILGRAMSRESKAICKSMGKDSPFEFSTSIAGTGVAIHINTWSSDPEYKDSPVPPMKYKAAYVEIK